MEKLETILQGTLDIAEKSMQQDGHVNPKVVIFYRDNNNDLNTYMIDLAPQKFFDDREEIMEKVGTFLREQKVKGEVRSFDTVIHYGEANMLVNGIAKPVIMAAGHDCKKNYASKYKEIQRYIVPEHPEKMFFNLVDLAPVGETYKSPLTKKLLDAFTRK